MTEDALLIEGNAPRRSEVGGESRPRRNPVMDTQKARKARLAHGARKGKSKSLDHLKKRQVHIGKLVVHGTLEIAHELRQPLRQENSGPPPGFALLVLVVEAGA